MMTLSVPDATTILLDIEGTTTPIDFVYEVLFPYARRHVRDFLQRRASSDEVRVDIAQLRQEQAEDLRQGLDPPPLRDDDPKAEIETIVRYVHWLIDQDRKSTPLKSLQGKIWEEGYRTSELKSRIFADVPPAFERWRGQGRQICIFSSGSVLAQKLLFAHTTAGDLTTYIHAYFDTTTGPKKEAKSYQCIADALRQEPSRIVFISDVAAELDAARSATMRTRLAIRPDNHPQPPSMHQVIHSFDELFPL